MPHYNLAEWLWVVLLLGVPIGLVTMGGIGLSLGPRAWLQALTTALASMSATMLIETAKRNWESMQPGSSFFAPALVLGLAIDIATVVLQTVTLSESSRGRQSTLGASARRIAAAFPIVTALAHTAVWIVITAR